LSTGSYQLICSPDGVESRQKELTVRRVQVVERESKQFIIIGDQTAEVRRGEGGELLFTVPVVHGGVSGELVTQSIYVSKRPFVRPLPARVDGIFRTMWPDGEEQGRFALIPVSDEKG
jgi:hypothetical protein